MTAGRKAISVEAAALMRGCRTAALATVGPDGAPFSSFVAIAPDEEGSPILLLSALAVHTANLQRDSRASLLLVGKPPADDPLSVPRLTLVGEVARAADPDPARERYVAVHPAAAGYSRFGDFAFYRMAVRSGHFVAGFGRIVGLTAEELLREAGGGQEPATPGGLCKSAPQKGQ